MDELVERLQSHPVTVDGDLQSEQQAWLDDLKRLTTQVRAWLASGVEKGVFHLTELEVQIDEQDVGTYEAQGLRIELVRQHRYVLLTPQGFRIPGVVAFGGRRVVGFRGRVDMSAGPTKVIFLRRQSSDDSELPWDVLLSTGERRPLSAATLADVLTHVIGED